jgi:hypothetical protein
MDPFFTGVIVGGCIVGTFLLLGVAMVLLIKAENSAKKKLGKLL